VELPVTNVCIFSRYVKDELMGKGQAWQKNLMPRGCPSSFTNYLPLEDEVCLQHFLLSVRIAIDGFDIKVIPKTCIDCFQKEIFKLYYQRVIETPKGFHMHQFECDKK